MPPGLSAVGVVPCAGASRRMGSSKALLDADGAPFLVRAVGTLLDGGCRDVVVVLPEAGAEEEARLARESGAHVLRNPDPGDGPITSLRVALDHLTVTGAEAACAEGRALHPCSAILVLPVDHPGVRPATVRHLLDRAAGSPHAEIVLPRFGKKRGHPALFRGSALRELRDPELTQGARSVVRRDGDRVLEVAVDDPAVVQDIDLPEGYLRWYGTAYLDAARAAEFVIRGLDQRRTTVVLTRLESQPPERRAWAYSSETEFETVGGLSDARLQAAADRLARRAARDPEQTGKTELDGEAVYIERHVPTPELIIVGAGHIAQPLSTAAALAGFRVVVADDRPDFATRQRFPDADRVVPFDFQAPFADLAVDEHTHVVLVTRGHKFDYECLRLLLKRERQPGYVGMIGSRRRVRATWEQLIAEGVSRERISAIRAPVGLDLGAQTPGEIALAVAAELVQLRRGGSGAPLRQQERVLERFFPDAGEEGES